MAAHTSKTVTLDAFQWNGGTLAAANLPFWTKFLALHTPGDGSLHVPSPTGRGTESAKIGDWVIQLTDGNIKVLSNVNYVALFN